MAEADPYPLYTKFVAADGRTLKAFEELDLVEAYSYEKKKVKEIHSIELWVTGLI